MKRKLFTALGLLLSLAALISVYFLAFNAPEEEIAQIVPPPSPAYRITERAPNEITRITITNEHGTMALAQDENGIWSGAEQFVHLNQIFAHVLASDFVNPTVSTRFEVESEGQLAEFGLEPPLRTVRVQYADGSTDILRVGHTTLDGRFFYALMEGRDHIYLIGAAVGNRYLWIYSDIVLRDMSFFDPEHIVNAALSRPDEEAIWIMPNFARAIAENIPPDLAFAGNSGLMMYAPIQGRGVWMNNFVEFVVVPAASIRLGNLADLSIENPEQYGLDQPILDLYFEYVDLDGQITGGNALPTGHWRFRAGNLHESGDYFYVFYDGIPHIFLVHRSSIIPLLETDFFRFIDRFVHLKNIGTVYSIRIESPDGIYDIILNHGDIDLQTAALDINPTINGRQVEEGSFISFYQALIGITYEHMIEPASPQGRPELVVTFNTFGRDGSFETTTSRFYHFDYSFYAVRGEADEDMRFLVSRQALNHLFRYLDMLLDDE